MDCSISEALLSISKRMGNPEILYAIAAGEPDVTGAAPDFKPVFKAFDQGTSRRERCKIISPRQIPPPVSPTHLALTHASTWLSVA